MVKLKLHLVTTGDERTWQPHEPVLFLGDWCLKHEQKQIYSELDYIKMEPTSINFNDMTRKEARNLEKVIFPTLVTILNHHHQTTYKLSTQSNNCDLFESCVSEQKYYLQTK